MASVIVKYTIGLDYDTNSVRALIVDTVNDIFDYCLMSDTEFATATSDGNTNIHHGLKQMS